MVRRGIVTGSCFAFDSLNPPPNGTEEIVLMKKLAPVMKSPVISLATGDTLRLKLKDLISDPDSLKNDFSVVINSISVSSPNFIFNIKDSFVYIQAARGFIGNVMVTLTATHDFISITKNYTITVKAPAIMEDEIIVFPNPVHSPVGLQFILAADFKTDLTIYSINGTPVKRVVDGQFLKKGYHYFSVPFDDMPAGVYFVNFSNKKFKLFIKQ